MPRKDNCGGYVGRVKGRGKGSNVVGKGRKVMRETSWGGSRETVGEELRKLCG